MPSFGSFTVNEVKVLRAWPTSYSSLESQLADNMSATDIAELASESGLPSATVKGVAGSLTKKGLAISDAGDGREPPACLWLTEEGVRVVYSKKFESLAEAIRVLTEAERKLAAQAGAGRDKGRGR